MDPASATAGLIGLAALAGQSTTKIVRIIKDFKEIPETLQKHLRWLDLLSILLKEIGQAFAEIERRAIPIDLSLLESYLRTCEAQVGSLAKLVETQIAKLNDGDGLRQKIRKIKMILDSKDGGHRREEIKETMDGLSLCHSSIMRYGLY